MLKISIIIALLAVIVAAVSNSDEKPGYCRIGDIYIKEGEQAPGPIGKCMRMKCVSATPGKESYSGVGCGTFVPRPECSMSAYDNTKRYPDCCPHEVCGNEVDDNNLE